jgi:pyruvate kinase
MRRQRNAKIVATLGPASSTLALIDSLFHAGVDVFRLNFSHGTAADHRKRMEAIRAVEEKANRPIGVLMDLQGPKLRIGTFDHGPVVLKPGAPLRLDIDPAPGSEKRVSLPHPEIFAVMTPGPAALARRRQAAPRGRELRRGLCGDACGRRRGSFPIARASTSRARSFRFRH